MEYGKQNSVEVIKLGLTPYSSALQFQEELFKELVDRKLRWRDGVELMPNEIVHHLLYCQHPHVYTLGKSGKEDHLLVDEGDLFEKGVEVYHIGRGGDITYHGPGQLVAYPIFDLDSFFTDIHKYLRYLEEAVIRTLAHWGIEAGRVEGLTGVWVHISNPAQARKICAMGVKASRWVTMHGLALNVNTDLSYFTQIVPCGIVDKGVTSIEQELGKKVDISEVEDVLTQHLSTLFEFSSYQKIVSNS